MFRPAELVLDAFRHFLLSTFPIYHYIRNKTMILSYKLVEVKRITACCCEVIFRVSDYTMFLRVGLHCTGRLLTENAEVTDIVNFSPLCPTIQIGSLRFRSFKYIVMQLYFITE